MKFFEHFCLLHRDLQGPTGVHVSSKDVSARAGTAVSDRRLTEKMCALKRVGALCGSVVFGTGIPLYASHNDAPILSAGHGALRSIPLGALSYVSDTLHALSIPEPLRVPVLGTYCRLASVSEQDRENLSSFSTLHAFRTRASSRKIDGSSALVSPADGRVVALGTAGPFGALMLQDGQATRVRDFLVAGERDPLCGRAVGVGGDTEASPAALRFALIVPGPSDGLSLSSPADWTIGAQRKVPGGLLAVNGGAEDGFRKSERVVLEGVWGHGMLSIVAVAGAGRRPRKDAERAKLSKGEEVNIGMAAGIVLLFEAPDKNFEWKVQHGDFIKRGERLACIGEGASASVTVEDAAALARLKQKKRKETTVGARVRRTW